MKPVTLNSALHYQVVANALNIKIINTYPPSANCRICRKGTVRIYTEPVCGGFWWVCDSCSLASTSFQLYQRVTGVRDRRTAWTCLAKDAGTILPPVLNAQTIRNSEEQDQLAADYVEFWDKAKDRLYQTLPARSIEIMQGLNAWDGFDQATWTEQLGQFVGCSNKQLILASGLDTRDLKQGFGDALVLGYETVPGKLSGLLFENGKRQVFKYVIDEDAGLLGLSVVKRYQEELFVITDPYLFLDMQRRHLRDTSEPAPCVVCVHRNNETFSGGITGLAWSSVHHKTVIFWEPNISIGLIGQARILGDRGMIATEPNADYLAGRELFKVFNVHQLMDRWRKSIKHWMSVLKTMLLNACPADGIALMAQLHYPLTHNELEQLRDICTTKEWQHIQTIYNPTKDVRSFTYGTYTIIERANDGWFQINSNVALGEPHEIRVANCYMRIHQVAGIQNEAYYQGEIYFDKQTIPFVERDAAIRADPVGFIRNRCVQHGAGVPVINQNYAAQMLEIALAASTPKQVSTISRVGWDPIRQEFALPQLTVKDGELIPRTIATIDTRRLPLATLQPSEDMRAGAGWDRPGIVTDLGLTMLGVILENIRAKMLTRSPRGLLVIDRTGAGELVLNKLCELLGIVRTRKNARATDAELVQLQAFCHEHDVPITTTGPRRH